MQRHRDIKAVEKAFAGIKEAKKNQEGAVQK